MLFKLQLKAHFGITHTLMFRILVALVHCIIIG